MDVSPKIISILGDSLAMPRIEEGINFENTYEYLLSKKMYSDFYILNKSKRGNTIKNQSILQYIYDDIEVLKPTFIIIQLGICDCAPRIIGSKERLILDVLAPFWFKRLYINLKSKNRLFLTKYFPRVNVMFPDFKLMYKGLIEKIFKIDSVKKVIVINICDTNQENKKRSFGFEENIVRYNSFLKTLESENIILLDLFEASRLDPNLLLEDGIHLSRKGHIFITDKISESLNSYKL
jgi:lysophospholipase L1-like esterase